MTEYLEVKTELGPIMRDTLDNGEFTNNNDAPDMTRTVVQNYPMDQTSERTVKPEH